MDFGFKKEELTLDMIPESMRKGNTTEEIIINYIKFLSGNENAELEDNTKVVNLDKSGEIKAIIAENAKEMIHKHLINISKSRYSFRPFTRKSNKKELIRINLKSPMLDKTFEMNPTIIAKSEVVAATQSCAVPKEELSILSEVIDLIKSELEIGGIHVSISKTKIKVIIKGAVDYSYEEAVRRLTSLLFALPEISKLESEYVMEDDKDE